MRGVWTALITPFNSSDELDLAAYRRILKDQREARVAGVVPCGTTGEAPALTGAEKRTLIRTAIEELRGSGVKVLAGTGSNNTAETIELSRWASEQGADGVLVVTPYYNRPTQAGLEAHYRAVADAVRCPVTLYNVPSRTAVSLAPETVARLASHPRIRSIKESSGSLSAASEILDRLALGNERMDLLSGDDALFLPMLSVGAVGVVSVASNLAPRAMVAIQAAFERGDAPEAQRLHRHFHPLFRDLFIESNPAPVKAAMAYASFCDARVRLPLAPLSAASARQLEESLRRCGVAAGRPL
jgi:4-hydroxy-tetrahydrodipicolinate synthase